MSLRPCAGPHDVEVQSCLGPPSSAEHLEYVQLTVLCVARVGVLLRALDDDEVGGQIDLAARVPPPPRVVDGSRAVRPPSDHPHHHARAAVLVIPQRPRSMSNLHA